MSDIKMSFDPEVSKVVGTDAAIILSNIEFWQATNKANNRNYHEGNYWTYNSIKAFNELFSYLTPAKIRRCLDKLEQEGYIISGNFNKASYDRTKWYCSIRQMHLSELANGIVKSDEPIPDNKPDNKPNRKRSSEKPNDENVYLNIDTLFNKYLANDKLIKAIIENNDLYKNKNHLEKGLIKFNKHLQNLDQTIKTWKDYTSHFLFWSRKEKLNTSHRKSPTDITL